jgi:hypothetical protein
MRADVCGACGASDGRGEWRCVRRRGPELTGDSVVNAARSLRRRPRSRATAMPVAISLAKPSVKVVMEIWRQNSFLECVHIYGA